MSSLSHIHGSMLSPKCRSTRVANRGRVDVESSDEARIFVASDQPLFRSGLAAVLNASRGFQVIGDAGESSTILRLVGALKPDVLLLDWDLSRRVGINLLSEIGGAGSSIKILLVSAPSDIVNLTQYMQPGVRGVLFGDATAHTLCKAIHTVMAGQYVLGNAAVANLAKAANVRNPKTAFQVAKCKFRITPREFELISKVVAGWSTADIVQRMSVSPNTLKHHMTHIFDKLGVSNRVELVLFAVKHIFSPEAASE